MNVKNAISWFEIPVSDYERAINFYESVFDTRLQRESIDEVNYAIFSAEEPAVSGALIKADFQQPSEQGSLVYLNAEGVMDDVIERAQALGAKVYIPKTYIGDPGYIAHIGDSEGNKIALHSHAE
ncbi:hypothetical protein MNBD_GAMMA08-2145 [hydrothermal vent metagenome]|uniref:VOC domain-containing protein n=1 Tax=hydrothermal vent metagenome TaxID=652676 RepID=A0A3B0XLC6_9ZZZZ